MKIFLSILGGFLIFIGMGYLFENERDGLGILGTLIFAIPGVGILVYAGIVNDAKEAVQEKVKEIKKTEAELYTQISQELESGTIDKGLWTQAEGESGGGDEKKVKSIYIKLRYKQLSRE